MQNLSISLDCLHVYFTLRFP